ncbi:MAG: NrsF family protein [Burkholderiales bacterium]|jgi:hypothetical protein
MKTDALIALLAQGAGEARPLPVARRLLPALALGLALAAVLAVALIGLLPASAFASPTPWIKLIPLVLLAGLAWQWMQRSVRPASATRPALQRLQVLWLVLALTGLCSLLFVPAEARMGALLGGTWWMCPLMLTALALPGLALVMHSARGLPVGRAGQAGAALGLLAGCVAAAGYALACPESSPAFVALWYSSGLLLCMALGAVVGLRRLRW